MNQPLRLARTMLCRFVDGSVGVGSCNLMSMLLFDLKQNLPSSTSTLKRSLLGSIVVNTPPTTPDATPHYWQLDTPTD